MSNSTWVKRVFGTPVFPTKPETGYYLQGLALGLVVGPAAVSPTPHGPGGIISIAFVILVVVGARLIRSSPTR